MKRREKWAEDGVALFFLRFQRHLEDTRVQNIPYKMLNAIKNENNFIASLCSLSEIWLVSIEKIFRFILICQFFCEIFSQPKRSKWWVEMWRRERKSCQSSATDPACRHLVGEHLRKLESNGALVEWCHHSWKQLCWCKQPHQCPKACKLIWDFKNLCHSLPSNAGTKFFLPSPATFHHRKREEVFSVPSVTWTNVHGGWGLFVYSEYGVDCVHPHHAYVIIVDYQRYLKLF